MALHPCPQDAKGSMHTRNEAMRTTAFEALVPIVVRQSHALELNVVAETSLVAGEVQVDCEITLRTKQRIPATVVSRTSNRHSGAPEVNLIVAQQIKFMIPKGLSWTVMHVVPGRHHIRILALRWRESRSNCWQWWRRIARWRWRVSTAMG